MVLDIRKEVVLNIKKLPTLPIIFEKILETIDDPNSSATILQETIKNDQSITAKVLNMANSAYYGYAKRVSDLSRAIVILGFDMVKNIALSVSVFSLFPEKEENNHFDRENFWLHSIASGYLGKIVAQHSNYYEPDKAFITCLLHDVGKVVLDCYFEEEYKKIIELSARESINMREAEASLFDCDHAELGYILGEKWNFPEELLSAIRYHHNPSQAPRHHAELSYLTYITNIVCQEEEIGTGGSKNLPSLDDEVLSAAKLKRSQLKSIKEEIQSMKGKLETLVRVMG